ncbi:MAG: chemotaxis protein CheW [Myxococcota bacterium]
MLCVIATAASYTIGIPADRVIEMLPLPKVSALPGQPAAVLGAATLRGQWSPVVGLRQVFGMPSRQEEYAELVRTLDARKKDHVLWVAELEASIRERRPFSMTTDAHKCAFGRWYDAFSTENLDLAAHLRLFKDPHEAIHGLADRVLAMAQAGQQKQAIEVIVHARKNTLARLLELFDDAAGVATQASQAIGVVVSTPQTPVVLSVDAVRSLEDLDVSAQPPSQSTDDSPEPAGVIGLAQAEDGGAILVLDVDVVTISALAHHTGETNAA